MSEQLDDELKKRISEVFDNYEEDTALADEGWVLLRERYPAKAKQRVLGAWFWRGMAAAVLLMLCIVGLWLIKLPNINHQVAQTKLPKQQGQTAPQSSTRQQPANSPTLQPASGASNNISSGAPLASSGKKDGAFNKRTLQTGSGYTSSPNQHHLSKHTLPQQHIAFNNAIIAPTQSDQTIPSVNTAKSAAALASNKATGTPAKDSMVNQPAAIFAQQQNNAVAAKKDSIQSAAKKPSMSMLFAKEKEEQAQKGKIDSKKPVDKKIIYSVYAATYVNYAKGSSSQANVGGGFTSDIRLSKNIKLSTGVAIAQNKLNYNSEPVQTGLVQDAIRVSNVSERAASPAAYNSLAPPTSIPAVAVKSYNVSLTGLDVPINIKYEFNPKKADSYVSAGLSSGTFINETYRYKYDNSNNRNALGATAESIPDATSSTSFSRFDFARTLNVALGMGVQLGKSNTLIVEPFLKYPLNGLGSQQIKFGAGGINLKLMFRTANK